MSRLGLGEDGAKSRYSQAYLSAVCSQSGHTLQEGRQDEDCWAVDTTVDLPAAPVLVQLKCTSSPKRRRRATTGFRSRNTGSTAGRRSWCRSTSCWLSYLRCKTSGSSRPLSKLCTEHTRTGRGSTRRLIQSPSFCQTNNASKLRRSRPRRHIWTMSSQEVSHERVRRGAPRRHECLADR